MSESTLITPMQLKEMAESLPTVIIDTRSPDAYERLRAGTYPGRREHP